jgi:hypothetical protein
MSGPDVVCRVEVYERDGVDVPLGQTETILVCSHWPRRELVALTVGGVTVAVAAQDLEKAIRAATL